MLDRFAQLVKKLTSTNGRIEKENYLRAVASDHDVLTILKFLFNPYIVTGISDKKLNKFKKVPPMFTMLDIAGDMATTTFADIMKYFAKNNTGRDEDIKYLVRFATAHPAHTDLIYEIIKRDLKLGIQNTTLNKVFGEDFVPKFDVMLAEPYADYVDYVDGKNFIITEKLDGVRCVLIFDPAPNFFSRNGKAILELTELTPEVHHLDPNYVYDGELLLKNPQNLKSEDLYRATVTMTNRDGAKTNLIFNVFDMIDKNGFEHGLDPTPAIVRKTNLEKMLAKKHDNNQCEHIRAVEMRYVGDNKNEIPKWLKTFCDNDGEGIMLNIADAPYECKRVKNLLKVKQFNTADVLVLDVEEGTGANRGKLGAVIIKFIAPDGKPYTCRVGSGFKLDEREKFWADKSLIKNKIIEIGYFELSRNQRDTDYSMRFPTFKHLRPDKTEISMK